MSNKFILVHEKHFGVMILNIKHIISISVITKPAEKTPIVYPTCIAMVDMNLDIEETFDEIKDKLLEEDHCKDCACE